MPTQTRSITLEQMGLAPSVEPMHLSHQDEWFEFPGYFKKPAHTAIEIYSRAKGGYKVVIATELDTNDGVSITNGSESLAQTLCRKLDIEPKNLVLIEHYEADRVIKEEHWSLVRFRRITKPLRFEDRQWFPLERTELERLLGTEIA